MMVANSFDLWQKDAFFSAAEEVQESADMYVLFFPSWLVFAWVLASFSLKKMTVFINGGFGW